MTILLVHNYYQQRGGEDEVFEAEARLLEAYGHRVLTHAVHNDDVDAMSRLRLLKNTFWADAGYEAVASLVRRERVAVVHFHNTLPLVSPAAYYAARRNGAAVVQTLHNYRLLCPGATFFRDGHVCEACLHHRLKLPSVAHGCYRSSRSATAAVAGMVAGHAVAGTWTTQVDRYVTLSRFARDKFVEAGFPAEKLVVKPNFVEGNPAPGSGNGGYAVFVGRLVEEKGIRTVLRAWERPGVDIPLRIFGDGPDAGRVRAAADRNPLVRWMGFQPLDEVYRQIGEAAFLVFPSEWYETFGRVAIEAFAKGTPVVAASIGAISELVDEGVTGFLFPPGDDDALAERRRWASDNPEQLRKMRTAARQAYTSRFTAAQNYEQLIGIYEEVVEQRPVEVPA